LLSELALGKGAFLAGSERGNRVGIDGSFLAVHPCFRN
jgi:hypothetical protein